MPEHKYKQNNIITSKSHGRCQWCCLCTEVVSCGDGGCVVQQYTKHVLRSMCVLVNFFVCCTAVVEMFTYLQNPSRRFPKFVFWPIYYFARRVQQSYKHLRIHIRCVCIATSIVWQVLYSSQSQKHFKTLQTRSWIPVFNPSSPLKPITESYEAEVQYSSLQYVCVLF